MKVRSFLVAVCIAGCARSGGSDSELVPLAAPLASFASVRMIALPVQSLRGGDSLGWSARITEPRRYLATLDSVFASVLRGRGLGEMWSFPDDLSRTARRNPMYASDPATIRAGDAVRAMERRRGSDIPEPVATQLRVLGGFHDARYALIPVELRFERGLTGGGRAMLYLAVLDVRASRLAWSGFVSGSDHPDLGPSIPLDLATRFADLVVSR